MFYSWRQLSYKFTFISHRVHLWTKLQHHSLSYLGGHILTDGLDLHFDISDKQVELILHKLQSVHLVFSVLQCRHSVFQPPQKASQSHNQFHLSGGRQWDIRVHSHIQKIIRRNLWMTYYQINLQLKRRKGRRWRSPLLRRLNVDGVHDVLDFLCNLLGPDCVLLKLCFHCWLRDTLLRGHDTHRSLWPPRQREVRGGGARRRVGVHKHAPSPGSNRGRDRRLLLELSSKETRWAKEGKECKGEQQQSVYLVSRSPIGPKSQWAVCQWSLGENNNTSQL